jgi:hypothetical protein
MTLPTDIQVAGNHTRRMTSSSDIAPGDRSEAGAEQAVGRFQGAMTTPHVSGDGPGRTITDAIVGGRHSVAAATTKRLSDVADPDIGAAMAAWSNLADAPATLAALDAISASNPIVKSLARQSYRGRSGIQNAATPGPLDPQRDLISDELHGGHTIERHVGKAQSYLAGRLGENPTAGGGIDISKFG